MDEEEFEAMKDMLSKKKKLVDTTSLVHSQAYNKAAEEHLLDDDGKVDYDKLKNSETQLKFVETLRDHYLEAAKKSLGAKDVEGELEEELLIQAYTGVTSQFFKDQISKKKHGYSIDEHKGVVDELRDVQDKELEGVIYGRIKEEHIPELVKRLGISDYVDTDKMRVEEVKQLAQIYFKSNESIAPKSLEGNHFYKEKKKAA